MLASSLNIILQRDIAAMHCLWGVVVIQGLGYGLTLNRTFFLRDLSVICGLLMGLVVTKTDHTKRSVFVCTSMNAFVIMGLGLLG
jgi:SURF4 family